VGIEIALMIIFGGIKFLQWHDFSDDRVVKISMGAGF
jgi:hypothetical protein